MSQGPRLVGTEAMADAIEILARSPALTSALENIVGWIQPWLASWGGAVAPQDEPEEYGAQRQEINPGLDCSKAERG